ncbi:hypothetical protein AAG570_001168 [Ranatra chinensis]|uniref:Uncharacterized protein n=1 Tax=Ranatra chinensis TaxID=642074 RepID=A0ABD0YMT1_9HEMI
MAYLVPEPIWNWVSKAWRSMDDLAEKIDDLICSFEGGGDTTMDTVAMYVFGWMLVVLFVVGAGKFVYAKFVERRTQHSEKVVTPVPTATATLQQDATEDVTESPSRAKPTSLSLSSPSPSKYVPPTPPARKRLGSKSGRGPPQVPLKIKTHSPAHPPPTATGPESESVRWVNDLFTWLYSDLVIVNELLNVWIQSLNELTKKSVAEHGVGVEFVRVLSESPPPIITNVFCECAVNDDVTITCDCETTPALQLKVFRQKGEKVEVSHYRLNVNRFRARLNILAISEKLLADIKCDGWPEIKVALAQVGSIKSNLDEAQLQDVITEIVTSALRNTDVHLNFSQYPTCPRLLRNVQTPSHLLPVHYDSIVTGDKLPEKRLLVKVIKATGIGATTGCHEPYCVVEVDEPPQKNQTSIKKDTNSPVWDEHFLFDVNQNTSELLLEVYDRYRGEQPKFLGSGIVSMDELITNPNQRQTISLQATPLHDSPISGTLTVEFLLIEGADVPVTGEKPFKLKETLRSVSPTGAVLTTTKTVFSHFLDRLINGGEGVTDSALRELERNKGLTTQANKSTLIIHSVQRCSSNIVVCVCQVEMTETGKWHEVPEHSQCDVKLYSLRLLLLFVFFYIDRSRSRKRKRDFFGTLRRRLNRSKTRSKSAGPPGDDAMQDLVGRSISADRARDPSAHSTGDFDSFVFIRGSYLIVPGLESSERSSLSEASGVSGASSRTYVNEASTLVLETVENGIKKYYLVPLSLAQRSKWKKKGIKLHIFNDHTFIAKHLSGGSLCQICKKTLARRIGKQGYECRDCQLRCHKHCHVRAETTCPTSNIQNIEL